MQSYKIEKPASNANVEYNFIRPPMLLPTYGKVRVNNNEKSGLFNVEIDIVCRKQTATNLEG